MILPGLPMIAPNETPIQITYLGTGTVNVNIGTARPDRIIVAVGIGENDAAGSLSGATFNGSAGTVIYGPTRSDSFGMAYKEVPTGNTVTVVMTQFGLQVVHLWMITGYKVGYDSYAVNTSGGATLTTSVSTPAAKCAMISAAQSSNSNSYSALTGSGDIKAGSLTTANSGNVAGGSNPSYVVGHAIGGKSGAGASITANSSGFVAGIGITAVFK